jgi:hypothetical protein
MFASLRQLLGRDDAKIGFASSFQKFYDAIASFASMELRH